MSLFRESLGSPGTVLFAESRTIDHLLLTPDRLRNPRAAEHPRPQAVHDPDCHNQPERDRQHQGDVGDQIEHGSARQHHQLEVHYQPEIDLVTGRTVAVEALLRAAVRRIAVAASVSVSRTWAYSRRRTARCARI